MKKKEKKRIFSINNFYKHPVSMLITILAITLFFALQIIRLNFDNNNFRFIPKNDPSRISAKKIADIFGEDVPILIGIERRFSTIIDKEFLDEVKQLDEKLKEIDLVKNDFDNKYNSYRHRRRGNCKRAHYSAGLFGH